METIKLKISKVLLIISGKLQSLALSLADKNGVVRQLDFLKCKNEFELNNVINEYFDGTRQELIKQYRENKKNE